MSITSPPNLPGPYDIEGWFPLMHSKHEDPATGLTPFETEVIRLHNDLRANPGKWADHLENAWLKNYNPQRGVFNVPGAPVALATMENSKIVKETIAYLRNKVKSGWKPDHGDLKPSKLLNATTRLHSHCSGYLGTDEHWSVCLTSPARWAELKNKFTYTLKPTKQPGRSGLVNVPIPSKDWKQSECSSPSSRLSYLAGTSAGCYENLCWSCPTPIEHVIQLVLDGGVPSRGHRTAIFTSSHAYMGVSVQFHNELWNQCSLMYDGKHHRDVISKERLNSVQDRMTRMDPEHLHPKAPAQYEVSFETCIKCGDKHLASANFFDNFLGDEKNPGRRICPKCNNCWKCKQTVSPKLENPRQAHMNLEVEGSPYKEVFHKYPCAKETLNIHCVSCKVDMLDAKIKCFVSENIQKFAPKQFSQFKVGDLICNDCMDSKIQQSNVEAEAASRERIQAEHKRVAEMQAKNQEEHEANLLKPCGYCNKDVSLREQPMTKVDETGERIYYHPACYDDIVIGNCGYCDGPIRQGNPDRASVEDDNGNMVDIHASCVDPFFKNKFKSKEIIAEDQVELDKDNLFSDVVCVGCEKHFAIGEVQHVDKQGQNWHDRCLQEEYLKTAPVCAYCNNKIGKDFIRSEMDDQVFHSDAAAGVDCSKKYLAKIRKENEEKNAANLAAQIAALPAGSVVAPAGTYSSAAKTCVECNKAIVSPDMPISFENKTYHRACFENRSSGEPCFYCEGKIPASSLSRCEGKAFHGDCVMEFFKNGSKKKKDVLSGAAPTTSTTTTTVSSSVPPPPPPPPPPQPTTTTTQVTSSIIDTRTGNEMNLNCVHCGKEVTNGAMISNAKRYHKECYQLANQSTCGYCLELITDVFNKCSCEGKDFHSNPDCLGQYFANGMQPKKK